MEQPFPPSPPMPRREPPWRGPQRPDPPDDAGARSWFRSGWTIGAPQPLTSRSLLDLDDSEHPVVTGSAGAFGAGKRKESVRGGREGPDHGVRSAGGQCRARHVQLRNSGEPLRIAPRGIDVSDVDLVGRPDVGKERAAVAVEVPLELLRG